MKQGRKVGFKHSTQTIEKIRQSRLGSKQKPTTKFKISKSMLGKIKSTEHKDHISNSMFNLREKCLQRYNELKTEYPEQKEFFETNRKDLLSRMEDIKSEKELRDIRRYIESVPLHNSFTYEYSSSSYFASEDAIIALVDAAAFIHKCTFDAI